MGYRLLSILIGCVLVVSCVSPVDKLIGPQTDIRGVGTPILILEAGAGDGASAWEPLRSKLAEHSQVFSYDRSRDTDASMHRSGKQVAVALQARLQEQGLKPPYVLVGHSIGGPFVLSFAMLYPDQVAGIVLVDGRPPGFRKACEEMGGNMCEMPTWAKTLADGWVVAEVNGMEQTYADLGDLSAVPNVPVVVMSATKGPLFANDGFRDAWQKQQREQAEAFLQGKLMLIPDTGHYIHHEQTALVETVVLDLIANWRRANNQ